MRVLMLDDEYMTWKGILDCLFEQVVYAATPAKALAALEQGEFDLMLLDGNLGVDTLGPDLLRRWKAEEKKLPPVVMFSGDDDLNQKGIEAGAMKAINKSRADLLFDLRD